MKIKRMSSMRLIPLSFLFAIIIGTFFLMLPISSASGGWTDFVTALFTATTSVCVTGLTVVDTISYWSTFGHVVILGLIQIGGFGIITVVSMFMLLTQKKFSLGDRKMLQDSLNLNTDSGILKILIKIFRGTITIELIGAILFAFTFVPDFGLGRGLWVSLFTSVSAFCNAGIDIIGTNSLGEYYSNPMVLIVAMALIVLGGLGYVVWFDLSSNIKKGFVRRFNPIQIFKRLGEHTKLVLVVTFSLIIGGWIIFLIVEFNNPGTIGNMSLPDKILNSLFESVTLRTAGFATFSQLSMTDFSCVICYIFMFIGGSPVGTAGGIKTVTFFIALMGIITYIKADDTNVLFNRRVSNDAMRKATVIVYISSFTIIVMTLILISTNPINMEDALFEVISASATVGLTRNLTTSLNIVGRVIIIISMYLGRIGPISMAIFFAGRSKQKKTCNYLEGKFFVG